MLRPSATEQSPQVADIVRDYAETEAAKRAQAFAFQKGLLRGEKQMALSDITHQMGLESREKIAGEKLATSQELHLADIGLKSQVFEDKLALENQLLEEAKEQSRRATIFSGISAALNLGAQWWQSKEVDKIIDAMTGERNAAEKTEQWIREFADKTLGILKETTEELKKKGRKKKKTFDYGPELFST
jgi:hypothetical protein